jgi:hypothetical protein
MLPTPVETRTRNWNMFSYNHWSQQATVESTRQTHVADCNEARGDGGRSRIGRSMLMAAGDSYQRT